MAIRKTLIFTFLMCRKGLKIPFCFTVISFFSFLNRSPGHIFSHTEIFFKSIKIQRIYYSYKPSDIGFGNLSPNTSRLKSVQERKKSPFFFRCFFKFYSITRLNIVIQASNLKYNISMNCSRHSIFYTPNFWKFTTQLLLLKCKTQVALKSIEIDSK